MSRSQIIDVATQSLANPYGLSTLPPEIYETLWWYSGAFPTGNSVTSAGSCLTKGSTNPVLNPSSSYTPTQLFTFNANWPSNTQFAFEVAIKSSAGSVNAGLWDLTTGTLVPGSQVSTSSTVTTVMRSGQFSLTKGHVYGVTYWGASGNYCYITDASLIVFPNQQLLAQGSLANNTLGQVGQKLTEAQIPLWVYSSSYTSSTGTNPMYIQKGSTSTVSQNTTSPTKLCTVSSSWPAKQKFALEASFWTPNSGATAEVDLYDSNGSLLAYVQTTSTTATVVRSSAFTLTPGHSLSVGLLSSSTSTSTYLTKAHLVPLFN